MDISVENQNENNVISKRKDFPCKKCKKIFKYSSQLKDHYKRYRKCRDKKQNSIYKCRACEYISNSKRNLAIHEKQ